MLDESYDRLIRIWSLPKGSISKKIINGHIYFYHQYRKGKKVISKLLQENDIEELKKNINERKKLLKRNKKVKEDIVKNAKVILIFNNELGNNLIEEMFAYRIDEIPFEDRKKLSTMIKVKIGIPDDNQKINEYFLRWLNGEIRAREISNYLIKKVAN